MTVTKIKLYAILFFAIPLMAFVVFRTAPTTSAAGMASDPAKTYKTKCAACHKAKATKFYDPAKTDEVHIEAILKGRKGAKPPYMPGYGEKGMTEDEAKALLEYMKTLNPAASS